MQVERVEVFLSKLRDVGWCRLPPMTDAGYREMLTRLGRPWCETSVELRADVRSYLCQPGSVPLHTDHPDADYTAWRCERQDDTDGSQLLVDGWKALEACGDYVRDALRHIHVDVRVRNGELPSRVPILRRTALGDRLFFALWITPIEMDPRSTKAFDELYQAVERVAAARTEEVRLRVGEVLVVDNGRVLHGRGPLSPTSDRLLRRFWITVP